MHYKVRYYDFGKDNESSFRASGHDFWCALGIVENILDEICGEGNYDILLFKAEPTINGEVQDHDRDVSQEFIEINCPKCTKMNNVPFGMKKFRCTNCGFELDIDYKDMGGEGDGENGDEDKGEE